ncbi:hypothetical protein IAG44_22050 [Streptomyces roseirectus]|uniref:Uncharacterized protein n=1 Tax=Streptomyces roseirectus TaxID=2768066 RepID=A0A7H0IGB4_9ACTN|nr:hypothetical protein [Streptomyces roseirectus]QNP71830.1 hypothetical protein IAG44_22050 [Streptomyces roseirectus]
MPLENGTRTGPTALGCLFLLVTTAGLLWVAASLLVSCAVTGFHDRPATPPGELLAKQANLVAYRLEAAAGDGVLTDAEISEAASAPWTAVRGADGVTVTVGHTPGPACSRYDVPLRDAAPEVRVTRLPACGLSGPE